MKLMMALPGLLLPLVLALFARSCEGLLLPPRLASTTTTTTTTTTSFSSRLSSFPIHHRHHHRRSRGFAPRASLVSGDDCWSMWGALSVAAAAGAKVGETKFGTFMSPPVCSMAITFLLSNIGVLPGGGESPHVAATQRLCVRMATPLLLYSADMRRVAAASGRLFPAFLLGTLASTAGAIIGKAATLRGLCAASSDGAKLAAALCAKNIGGGLNYVAVCETLQVSPVAAAAGLTVDNVMALLYFPLCDFLGRRAQDPEQEEGGQEARAVRASSSSSLSAASSSSSEGSGEGAGGREAAAASAAAAAAASGEGGGVTTSVAELSAALAVAVCVVAVAERLFPAYSVVAATLLTVGLATAFPRLLGPLGAAGTQLGTVFLYVFFATAGASGGGLGATLVGIGPPLLAYLGVLYCVHLSLLLAVGSRWRVYPRQWLPKGLRSLPQRARGKGAGGGRGEEGGGAAFVGLGFPRATLLTASNANIGGPATACALSVGHGWRSLVTPALVVGNFGYVVANFVALALYAAWTR